MKDAEELKSLLSTADAVALVDKYRSDPVANADIKKEFPCISPMGVCKEGSYLRSIDTMQPTGLGMLDIDKLPYSYEELKEKLRAIPMSQYMDANIVMCYITISGHGVRMIYPLYEDLGIVESAYLTCIKMGFPPQYIDTACKDISRLSVLTKWDDVIFCRDIECEDNCFVKPVEPTADDIDNIVDLKIEYGSVEEYIMGMRPGKQNATPTVVETRPEPQPSDKGGDMPEPDEPDADDGSVSDESAVDADRVPYKRYTEKQVTENDLMYKDSMYKGRRINELALAYINWKLGGTPPEVGERHSLYNILCRNFRNLVDNDPRRLHAVLPTMGHTTEETWPQCVHYTVANRSGGRLPKDFYFWMKDHGYLDVPVEVDEVEPIVKAYEELLDTVPKLPPIMAEYFRIAPKWFKIPTLVSLECILSLYATNYRAKYIDGLPLSLSFYDIVYAPQSSGKSYLRRLDGLLENMRIRDELALMKQGWFDSLRRRRASSDELPEEPKVKQRLFAARASVGQMCISQKNLGEHHFLQIISEFDIWSDAVQSRNCDLSAFYRTSWDNEYFSQQFQSANSFRGSVRIFPIILATCTEGQINRFFKNTEDGLVTRFDYIPLLNQEFADLQPWALLTDKDNLRIERTLKRLEDETYMTQIIKQPEDVKFDELKDDAVWNYELREPQEYDMSFLYAPIHDWLLQKLDEAVKDGNAVAAMLRKRSARKGFMFGLLCRALWGREDTTTQKRIVEAALWRAELSYRTIRYKWEDKMQSDVKKISDNKPGRPRKYDTVYAALGETFTRSDLEATAVSNNTFTNVRSILCVWKSKGIIKEIAKHTYKKTNITNNQKNKKS